MSDWAQILHTGSLGEVMKDSIFCFAKQLKMAKILAISWPFLIFRQNKKYSFSLPHLRYPHAKFQPNLRNFTLASKFFSIFGYNSAIFDFASKRQKFIL